MIPAAWALVPLLAVAGAALLPGGGRIAGFLLLGTSLLLQILLARRRSSDATPPGEPGPQAALWCLVAVLGVAAALRLWHLGSLPEGFWYDEAEAGLEARRILAGEGGIFAHYTDNTSLTYWAVAALFSLIGPSVLAVRLVSAAAGVGVAACCYFAGKEAGGRGAGLMAAWFGGTVAWGITFSRLGMPYMVGALFTVASCWLVLRAIRSGRGIDFAMAGLVTGIGQYSYTTFRAFLPAAVVLTILMMLIRRRRALAPGLALFWLAVLVVSLPLIVATVRQPGKYFGRIAEASVLTGRGDRSVGAAVGGNLAAHLVMFHLKGDPNGRHNLPMRPMLEPVVGAGLLLGVAALARAPLPASALLLLLFAGGLSTGVLSLTFEAPQAARTSGLIPLVAILAGLGWWRWYRSRPPGRASALLGAVILAGLAAGSGLVSARWYFVDQARDFSAWSSHSPGPTWVARRWGTMTGRRDVLIDPIYKGQRTIEFLAPGMGTERIFNPSLDLPLDPGRGGSFLALSHFEVPYLDILSHLYPCERRTGELGEAMPPPPADRGILEQLLFAGVPSPQAVTAVIPEGVVGSRAGWLTSRSGVATTIVNLPEPGIVEAADLPARISIDGGAPGAFAETGMHLVSVPLDLRVPTAPPLHLRKKDGTLAPLPALLAADRLPPGWRAQYRPLGEGEGFSRFEWRPDRYVHLVPLPRPYAVTWRGVLTVPRAGEHVFFVRIIGKAELKIDDATVVTAGPEGEEMGNVTLAAGPHQVVLTFTDDRPYSQIFLDWRPPGGDREPLPYGLVTVE